MKHTQIKFSITILTVLIITAVMYFYTNSSKKIFIRHAFYSVEHNTEEKSKELDTSINYALNSIKLLSNFTSDRMTERELKNPNEVFSIFSDKTPFNLIEYIRWDGLNLMNSVSGGEPFDASERVYYKNGIKGQTGIWANYKPKASAEALLNFYSPLYFQDEIVGVITGAIGGKTGIVPMLECEYFGQPITSILCDENYRIISSTDDSIPYGVCLEDFEDNQFVERILEYAKINNNKAFEYKENGKNGICCVANVSSTGWKVIMIVLPKSLKDSMSSITNRMVMISVFIILILVAYLVGQIHLNRIASKEIEEKQMNIINSLGLIYQNVYSVNIKTEELSVVRMSNRITSLYGQAFPAKNYKDAIAIYVENEVLEEDRKLFDIISDVKKVVEIFKNNDEYSFIYRILDGEEIHYFQCCLFRSSHNAEEFVAGFKDVDKLMEKQLDDQDKMNELIDMQATQISILGSLSGIYLTSHLIDLDKDLVVEFNTSSEVKEHVNKISDAVGQMENVIKSVVVPESVEEMLAFTNLRTLPKRLKNKKIISKEFVGNYHGWTRASFITVECNNKGLPFKVLFVTQVIDDEKKREEKLISSAKTDELTGLLNRNAYEDDLRIFKANPPEDNFVYISFDVNGLKTVNDSLGHEAGDELIRGASRCLQQCFGSYGSLYRTGGDEFQAIIFADEDKLNDLKLDFDQITSRWTGNLVDELRISAGYVLKKENPELSISEITKLADQRMYKEKSLYYSSKGIDRRGQQIAFDVLCHSYTKILKINLTSDEFSIIQMNQDEQNALKGYSEKISEWLTNFGKSGQVHDEDVDEYLEKTDYNFLKEYFTAGNKAINIQYRRKIGERFCKVMMEMIPSQNYSEDNQELFLYVKNIDKDI